MQKIFDFLTELSHNNNREWFNAHKEQYVACHERFVAWNAQLLEKLAVMDPALAHLTPKDCIWRIYRDVRFSKDKRPYKEWFGTFPAIGGKKGLYAGYYVHIQPDNCLFAGGMWCPPSNLVKKIRQDIYENYDEVEEIFAEPHFKRYFSDFDYEYALKKVPIGFDKEFIHADWLRLKTFTISHHLSNKEVLADSFTDLILDIIQASKPMIDFLNYSLEEVNKTEITL